MWSRTTAPLQPLTLQVKHFLAAHFAAYIGWEDFIPRLLWGLCLILWYYCIYVVHLFIIKSNFDWLVDTYCIYFAHLYLLNLFWEWILHITQFKWKMLQVDDVIRNYWEHMKYNAPPKHWCCTFILRLFALPRYVNHKCVLFRIRSSRQQEI